MASFFLRKKRLNDLSKRSFINDGFRPLKNCFLSLFHNQLQNCFSSLKAFNEFYHFMSFLKYFLKVVSTAFLLFYFLSLKKRACETRKNVFYFNSKALFVLEKIKIQNF